MSRLLVNVSEVRCFRCGHPHALAGDYLSATDDGRIYDDFHVEACTVCKTTRRLAAPQAQSHRDT